MRVQWIKGHSDTELDAKDVTVHHERNQEADKATKRPSRCLPK